MVQKQLYGIAQAINKSNVKNTDIILMVDIKKVKCNMGNKTIKV